jgi:predicted GNAT superfamily acetyltransferase
LTTVVIREVTDPTELALFPVLEKQIWGEGDAVSINMLVATLVEGGLALGAFAGEKLVGSVYGFASRDPAVFHSHYLAVLPHLRRNGIGSRLKQAQGSLARRRGYRLMRWTFDPLQLTNAYLNLNRLGTVALSYHINHYGELAGINGGLPSDRLTTYWYLHPSEKPIFDSAQKKVTVPEVTPAEIAAGSTTALRARLLVRKELEPLLATGWRVTSVDLDSRHYVLQQVR